MVLPVGSDITEVESVDSMPTFVGEGFIATRPGRGRSAKITEPWRREGAHGWFHDRRSSSAYSNVDNLPVISTGFVCSCDGFNYLSGNRQYSVRGTYLAPACVSPALLRRLRTWWMVGIGVHSRWEEEITPLTSILQMLENGCLARVRTGDERSETAFVRGGLLAAILDSPEQSDWTNTKHSNGSTELSCQRCKVPRSQLGNPAYDFRRNGRTAEGVDKDIEYAEEGATRTERIVRGRKLGVVAPRLPNPLKKLTFDRQLQVPFDILHFDALNKCKRMIRFLLSACDDNGLAVVSARLSLRQLLPPNASPLGDITSDGGWGGLTGNQIWIISSILPLLFAPVFADVTSMEQHVRSSEIGAVAERTGADPGTHRGKKKVCLAFRDLIKSCSASTFMVRAGSYTESDLGVLEKSEMEQIRQASRVLGQELGSFHKGLHVADDIRNLGAVGNANAGESKHKEVKKSAPSASGRDNPVHIYRAWNDTQALKSLCDGVKWSAVGYDKGVALRRDLTPGPLCRQVLQEVFKILPLQMNPAATEDGLTMHNRGRPHGYIQVKTSLPPVTSGTHMGIPAWQQALFKTLPTAAQLETRYDEALGCGRTAEDPACSSRTCSFCWRNRGAGLVRRTVRVFNHWGEAPAEASAGVGILRGGTVKDATASGWTRSTASRASDVELYVTAAARRSECRGLGSTTLGRVAYFFEHQGNDWRRGDDGGVAPEGVFTVWVAVSEYVTAGVGHKTKVDPVTGLDEFRMRTGLTFYPASAIRRVVHMMHYCPTTGASACGLRDRAGGKRVWRCTLLNGSTYLLNKYFHSVGRDSIA
ncbi:unnamed protein product [Scytosiphon promiscuus]